MAARSQWKGFLKLSLVSVPVKAYSATTSGAGEVQLNQLHAECNSRIRYKKTCEIHGEVTQDQIVSGYEYSKGQYVIVNPDDLDKLRTEDEKAIDIDSFIPAESFDPLYLTGKSYYLVPEGPIGQKAYQVILQGMLDSKRFAVAQVVMHSREQLVLIRPLHGFLVMSTLNYASQISSPASFEEEAPKTPVAPEELQLVKTLIKASSKDKADLTGYKDVYTQKLSQLIEAKVSGKELVAVPTQEPVQIINLMDALRQSVEKAQKTAPAAAAGKATAKPPRKMAASKGTKPADVRKKKSS
jgi:DNA end-binding protein Ku